MFKRIRKEQQSSQPLKKNSILTTENFMYERIILWDRTERQRAEKKCQRTDKKPALSAKQSSRG